MLGSDRRRVRRLRRREGVQVTRGLWIALALCACSFTHKAQEDFATKTTLHVFSQQEPWTFDRTIHGREYAPLPDGGTYFAKDLRRDGAHGKRRRFRDGRSGPGYEFPRQVDDETTAAIPVFRIAAALAALAVGALLLHSFGDSLRYRNRQNDNPQQPYHCPDQDGARPRVALRLAHGALPDEVRRKVVPPIAVRHGISAPSAPAGAGRRTPDPPHRAVPRATSSRQLPSSARRCARPSRARSYSTRFRARASRVNSSDCALTHVHGRRTILPGSSQNVVPWAHPRSDSFQARPSFVRKSGLPALVMCTDFRVPFTLIFAIVLSSLRLTCVHFDLRRLLRVTDSADGGACVEGCATDESGNRRSHSLRRLLQRRQLAVSTTNLQHVRLRHVQHLLSRLRACMLQRPFTK
jgi:hypothetical protein